jgi:hypothetical protein
MTPQEVLIKFMKRKAVYLGPDYFYQEDMAAIKKWSDLRCRKIINHIIKAIKAPLLQPASDLCPFCIHWLDFCDNCEYARHHGCCNSKDSHYWMMVQQRGPDIAYEVVKNHSEQFLKILNHKPRRANVSNTNKRRKSAKSGEGDQEV